MDESIIINQVNGGMAGSLPKPQRKEVFCIQNQG